MPREQSKKNVIEWRAPESTLRRKSLDWFFGAGLIALALGAWALYTVNIMFLLVVIVGTLTLFILAQRKTKTYHFKITEEGIWIGKRLTSFSLLDSFWVFAFPHRHILSLKPKARLAPSTHVAVPPKESASIKTILSQYLPEVEEQYSFVDWLADWLGL